MPTIVLLIILIAAGVALMCADKIVLKILGLVIIILGLYCVFALLV